MFGRRRRLTQAEIDERMARFEKRQARLRLLIEGLDQTHYRSQPMGYGGVRYRADGIVGRFGEDAVFDLDDGRGLEVRNAWLHQKRIEDERSIGRAYVACLLDEMCRDLGLDPVTTWRIPRANEARDRSRAQLMADLASPSGYGRRQNAEAVWLKQAREHQALQDPT